jgi:hypothetical protein
VPDADADVIKELHLDERPLKQVPELRNAVADALERDTRVVLSGGPGFTKRYRRLCRLCGVTAMISYKHRAIA